MSIYLSFQKNYRSVNKTSTEARLAPGSCTVEYKQLYMYTLTVLMLFSLTRTHFDEFYNSRNSCSRIVLVSISLNYEKNMHMNYDFFLHMKNELWSSVYIISYTSSVCCVIRTMYYQLHYSFAQYWLYQYSTPIKCTNQLPSHHNLKLRLS